jgi:hypothetical protein
VRRVLKKFADPLAKWRLVLCAIEALQSHGKPLGPSQYQRAAGLLHEFTQMSYKVEELVPLNVCKNILPYFVRTHALLVDAKFSQVFCTYIDACIDCKEIGQAIETLLQLTKGGMFILLTTSASADDRDSTRVHLLIDEIKKEINKKPPGSRKRELKALAMLLAQPLHGRWQDRNDVELLTVAAVAGDCLCLSGQVLDPGSAANLVEFEIRLLKLVEDVEILGLAHFGFSSLDSAINSTLFANGQRKSKEVRVLHDTLLFIGICRRNRAGVGEL